MRNKCTNVYHVAKKNDILALCDFVHMCTYGLSITEGKVDTTLPE
jgi:hypothetical protein